MGSGILLAKKPAVSYQDLPSSLAVLQEGKSFSALSVVYATRNTLPFWSLILSTGQLFLATSHVPWTLLFLQAAEHK